MDREAWKAIPIGSQRAGPDSTPEHSRIPCIYLLGFPRETEPIVYTYTQIFIDSRQNNEVIKEGEWTKDGVKNC